MPPEEEQGVEEATPVTESAPEEGTAADAPTQPEIDWQKRYEDQRSEFDRRNSELEQLRPYKETIEALYSEDTEERKRAADALGIQFDEPVEEEPLDEVEALKKELTDIKQWRETFTQEQQQQSQQQQEMTYLDQQFTALEQKELPEGVQFSQEELKLLAFTADHLRDDQNRPDVEAAYKLLTSTDKTRSQRRVRRKAPQVQGGAAGSQEVDLSTPQKRADHIARRLNAEEAS